MAQKQAAAPQWNKDDEDATTLSLGPDFQNAQCLTISEVKILLDQQTTTDDQSALFHKTLEYAQRFGRQATKHACSEVRKILSNKELEEFEIAMLANLVPEDPDEVRDWIPTVSRKVQGGDEIKNLLDSVSRFTDK